MREEGARRDGAGSLDLGFKLRRVKVILLAVRSSSPEFSNKQGG